MHPMIPTEGRNVFFADLHHPGGEEDEINQLLDSIPGDSRRIFLLGDIFHFWINDPMFILDRYHPFLARLQALAEEGLHLFFIEGNRDFLASHYLDEQPWIDVLPNPTLIELNQRVVYIGHGDELCWNDWAYQSYKTVIRSSPLRMLADRLPGPIRQSIVQRMSDASVSFVAGKNQHTLSVPESAYRSVVETGVDVIVHGHVHETFQRPIVTESRMATVYSFGWKDGKRNLIHFEG